MQAGEAVAALGAGGLERVLRAEVHQGELGLLADAAIGVRELGKGIPSHREKTNDNYYFGIPQADSKSILYVIDCSGSMRAPVKMKGGTGDTTRMEACKTELIRGLGENPFTDQKPKQYLFEMPLESWVDVAWFHGIGDRVGLYVGIEWMGSTYEPLADVSPQPEKDERFHANAGVAYVREIIKTEDGRKEAQDGLHKWWPAVLDMFGRSDSKNSEVYVKWGIKAKSNEELRRQYIADTVPVLESLELDVPDHLANRRFL